MPVCAGRLRRGEPGGEPGGGGGWIARRGEEEEPQHSKHTQAADVVCCGSQEQRKIRHKSENFDKNIAKPKGAITKVRAGVRVAIGCLLAGGSVAYQLVRSVLARAEEGGASGGAAVRPRHLRVRHRWLGYAH